MACARALVSTGSSSLDLTLFLFAVSVAVPVTALLVHQLMLVASGRTSFEARHRQRIAHLPQSDLGWMANLCAFFAAGDESSGDTARKHPSWGLARASTGDLACMQSDTGDSDEDASALDVELLGDEAVRLPVGPAPQRGPTAR